MSLLTGLTIYDSNQADCFTFVQYRHRIIFLSKPVDEELGNQLVATMLYLDSENQKDLNLYINCSGGNVSLSCICGLFKQLPAQVFLILAFQCLL